MTDELTLEWPDGEPKTRFHSKPTAPWCYTIVRAGKGVYRWACSDVWVRSDNAPAGHSPDGCWSKVFTTLDAAKSACQADLDERVSIIARAHIEAKDGYVGSPTAYLYRTRVKGAKFWDSWLLGRAPALRTDVYEVEEIPVYSASTLAAQQSEVAARDAEMPLSDVHALDAVVHALGIEDSHTTPADAVTALQSELAATVSQRDEWQAIAAAKEAEIVRLRDLVSRMNDVVQAFGDQLPEQFPSEIFQALVSETFQMVMDDIEAIGKGKRTRAATGKGGE